MAWWNDILQLLRDEVTQPSAQAASLQQLREAEQVLQRTTRELDEARGRAEAARRRMQQAQDALQALAQESQVRPGHAQRLTELARALTHESELVATFDAHIERLTGVRDRLDAQLRQLGHDLDMADAALGAAATSRAAAAQPASTRGASRPGARGGFRQRRDQAVMDALQRLPDRPGDDPRRKADDDEG